MTLTEFLIKHIHDSAQDINRLYAEGYLKEKMNWLEGFRAEIGLMRIKISKQN